MSSSYEGSGAVIVVISLRQDVKVTLKFISECRKNSFIAGAFIRGWRAFNIDFDGDCSTFDKRPLVRSRKQ